MCDSLVKVGDEGGGARIRSVDAAEHSSGHAVRSARQHRHRGQIQADQHLEEAAGGRTRGRGEGELGRRKPVELDLSLADKREGEGSRRQCLTGAGFAISTRWPRRPNPVTSVQAVHPCALSTGLAAWLLCCMDNRALETHLRGDEGEGERKGGGWEGEGRKGWCKRRACSQRWAHLPLAFPFIAAAMSVPVPRGLVSTIAWPAFIAPLLSTLLSGTSPLIVKPGHMGEGAER